MPCAHGGRQEQGGMGRERRAGARAPAVGVARRPLVQNARQVGGGNDPAVKRVRLTFHLLLVLPLTFLSNLTFLGFKN